MATRQLNHAGQSGASTYAGDLCSFPSLPRRPTQAHVGDHNAQRSDLRPIIEGHVDDQYGIYSHLAIINFPTYATPSHATAPYVNLNYYANWAPGNQMGIGHVANTSQ